MVSDVKSITGKWVGLVYASNAAQPDSIELAIREDGSYDVVHRRTVGTSHSRGKIEISGGRLVFQGERGRGTGLVMSSPGGERVMKIDATLSDNATLSANLWPSR